MCALGRSEQGRFPCQCELVNTIAEQTSPRSSWHWPGMLLSSIRKISCGWANNIDYSNSNTSVKKEKKYICIGEHLQNFCVITDSTYCMVPAYGGKYPSKILQRWSLVICQCLPSLPGDFILRVKYNWCSVLSFGLFFITTACVI